MTMKNSFSRIYNNFTSGYQKERIYIFIRPKFSAIAYGPF